MKDPAVWGLQRPKAALIRLIWLPVVIAGTVWMMLGASDYSAPLWQLWLLSLVFIAATTVTVPLSMPYPKREDLLPVQPARLYSNRSFGSVFRWEARIAGQRDAEDYRRVAQQRIVLLVAERLRLRHGIELQSGDGRAQQLLGEPLYRFCTRGVHKPLNHDELARLISRIEEI